MADKKTTEKNFEGERLEKQRSKGLRPNRKKIIVVVVGVSPLIHNKFSAKAKRQMAEKQSRSCKTTKGKEARDPKKDFEESQIVYARDDQGNPITWAVKACWFKLGMLYVAKEDKKGETIKRNIQVGDSFTPDELLPLVLSENGGPYMRVGEEGELGDWVRNANGVADIRYRAEFSAGWCVKVPITYNENRVSEEQVLSWLDEAGTASGIGDWRPQKNGQCGMYVIGKVERL